MKWRSIYWLGYLWILPRTIIGVLIALIFYRAHSWRWQSRCVECIGGKRIWGKPDGQTWGFLIVYEDEDDRASKELSGHERVHVVQSILWLEIPFLLIYLAHFAARYLWEPGGGWWAAYRGICFENQAYRLDEEIMFGDLPEAWV